jgi:xylulokinase
MAVLLSAASALEWAARVCGFADVPAALAAAATHEPFAGPELFLPYLSGERTPHNDPAARGAWVGLDHATDAGRLIMSVLEGVAFAFADGSNVLEQAGAEIGKVCVIGGGARSHLWSDILAAALGRTLDYRRDSHVGPAFGAARLARLAGGDPLEEVCVAPPLDHSVQPHPALIDLACAKRARFAALYPVLKGLFK